MRINAKLLVMNIIFSLLVALAFVHPFYFWALAKKDYSVIDVGWSLGFITICLTNYLLFQSGLTTHLIVLALISIWGLRLAVYLLIRNLRHKQEDVRYTKMRNSWGKHANLHAYVKVFLLQGTLMFLILLPFHFFFTEAEPQYTWTIYLGTFIWLVGFLFEAIGDHQQNVFKKNPDNKGKFCNVGLWKYTRHPNYFGEVVLWWGLFLIVAPFVPWWTVLGPILITILILKVSGIPMHEERYNGRADYEEYKRVTSEFYPLPPQK